MFGIMTSRRKKLMKEAHEKALKDALADKMAHFEDNHLLAASDKTDYTVITVNGKDLRVAKEQITIHDIDAPPLAS